MPEFVALSDPHSPLRIEYSCPVMERIRALAREGLMALPRVGMGVGGLLLGDRRDGLARVLDLIEIACSHAAGPSFNLSPEEKDQTRQLIAGAGQPGVVGWYYSKTRGPAVLEEAEISLFRELFPGPEQIALVLRPSAAEPMRAAFFFRDRRGGVVKAVECLVEEWREEPAGADAAPLAEAEAKAETEGKGEPNVAAAPPKPAASPQPVDPKHAGTAGPSTPPAPLAQIPAPQAQVKDPTPVKEPVRPVEAPQPPRRKPAVPFPDPFALPVIPPRRKTPSVRILAAVIAIVIAAVLFFTRDLWMPKPALTLTSKASNGNLVVRWNVDALRGIDRAVMYVNDGGNLQALPLDRVQLNTGMLIYTPKSERVTATLAAGDANAIAVWFAPAPEKPAAKPPDDAPVAPQTPQPAK